MIKMNFTDNQTAFEYALYMIASSYFDRAICQSKLTERNMLLQYKEQKMNNQYQMEEICIRFMDELATKASERFFNQNMVVHLRRNEEGNTTEILFENKNCAIVFSGLYAGKKTKIDYQIWVKKSNQAA